MTTSVSPGAAKALSRLTSLYAGASPEDRAQITADICQVPGGAVIAGKLDPISRNPRFIAGLNRAATAPVADLDRGQGHTPEGRTPGKERDQ
jgi:hypothetical protein